MNETQTLNTKLNIRTLIASNPQFTIDFPRFSGTITDFVSECCHSSATISCDDNLQRLTDSVSKYGDYRLTISGDSISIDA